jgi:AcrR family transcriptional regulator
MRTRVAAERERISKALVDLAVDHGFPSLTLPMVLARAGVDENTFHHYFSDLEECFCAVYEPMRDEFLMRVAAAYGSEQGWRHQMRAAAYAMLGFLGEDLRRARFMSVEMLYAGDRAKLIRDEAMQAFFLMIDQGRYEMEDPDSLSPYTAETVGSAIYQRIQRALAREEFDAFGPGVQEMMYMAVLPYLGPEVAAEELHIQPPPFPGPAEA